MSRPSPELALENLFRESLEDIRRRERSAFDEAAGKYSGRVVIAGAGGLGQKIHTALTGAGVEVLAFTDNQPARWGQTFQGGPILRPEEAAQRFGGDAVFVIAVWNPSPQADPAAIEGQLRGLGCSRVVFFPLLFWKFSDRLLPYYLWDLPSRLFAEADALRSCLGGFLDEHSKWLFVRQVQLRFSGDFAVLDAPSPDTQYFPAALHPGPDEHFVDCGAYRGETLDDFVTWTSGAFRRADAFEADPASYSELRRHVAKEGFLDRVVTHPFAVSNRAADLRFHATGSGNAAVSDDGDIVVQAVTLDECLRDQTPTFIKMDIEGEELNALDGARQTIARVHPMLAICAYHEQSHLWRVPQKIAEYLPGSGQILRQHCVGGFDLVCYGIPERRLRAGWN